MERLVLVGQIVIRQTNGGKLLCTVLHGTARIVIQVLLEGGAELHEQLPDPQVVLPAL